MSIVHLDESTHLLSREDTGIIDSGTTSTAPVQRKKVVARRNRIRRRWRVACIAVRCVVKLHFVALRGVFLTTSESRLLSSSLENYHTHHGPLLGGPNVLRHCLRVTGIEDVSSQLAERLFARVSGNFAKPLSKHQFLKVCRYLKEHRLANAVPDALEAYTAIKDRANAQRNGSASATTSMDDVSAAVRSFGLQWSQDGPDGGEKDLARSSRFDSQGSFDRGVDAAPPTVTYKDFVDRFFQGDDGFAQMAADAKGRRVASSAPHSRPPGHASRIGADITRKVRARRSVAGDGGASSVVSGLSSMESVKSRDDDVTTDEALAAAAEANALPSKKMSNRLKAALRDHSNHSRMLRSRAHHAEEAAFEGPQSHLGRWMPRGDGVLQSRFEIENPRPKPDAEADGLSLRLRLHGTTQPLHHRHPVTAPPQRVSSTRPNQKLVLRPSSAAPTLRKPKVTLQEFAAATASRPASPEAASSSYQAPVSLKPRPATATPARSRTFGTTSSSHVVPPQLSAMDSYVRNMEEADEIVHALQRRPQSALASRVPRSKVATELFDKLRSKTVDDFANTPSFALPVEERMQFLDAKKHIIPPALLVPRGLLQETQTVAQAALQTIQRWRSPPKFSNGAHPRLATPTAEATADVDTAPPAAPHWSM